MYSPALGLAAGQEPNGEHRAGTVYVAEQIDTFSAPFTLTEWDLATGQALQRTALPVDPTNTSPVMVFAGGRLHLVDWGFDHRPYYFQLTPSLQVVAKDHVIGMAGPRPNALASDGALTVIVARDPAWDGATEFARTFAVTFEAAGKPLSRRALDPPGESPSSALLQDNAAVASGDVYVLHHSDAGLSILRLAADLNHVGVDLGHLDRRADQPIQPRALFIDDGCGRRETTSWSTCRPSRSRLRSICPASRRCRKAPSPSGASSTAPGATGTPSRWGLSAPFSATTRTAPRAGTSSHGTAREGTWLVHGKTADRSKGIDR